ncbi:hypothetical protein HJC23_008309 [Cyclotella cryptica]|uniref:Uncharacterized protein n=1 Tax=Cyclotella cryptica TaxID=29204 RepID=A0ABD3Q5Q9_9STRA|eukprot:CCRYP_008580-RA/>CCRYP_008580-RA protein AED:0.37 eAED:0.37 QI:0/-1/0/1/-1/1/1/0/501
MPSERKEEVAKVNPASAASASSTTLRSTGTLRGPDAKGAAGQKIVESTEQLVSTTAPAKTAPLSLNVNSSHHGTTHHQKAMAEQRRREALEESLADFLPIENLRTVGKMTEEELNESKSLVRCFLSGTYIEKRDLQSHGRNIGTTAKRDRSTRYIHEFQHDLKNISTSYHYSYDPALPLPESLLNRPRLRASTRAALSATKNSNADRQRHKTKRQKTVVEENEPIEDSNVNLLSKIPDEHLLLAFPQDQDVEEEEDAACETTPTLVTHVPSIVRVNVLENQEGTDVMDASEQSSQNSSALGNSLAVEEASLITLNPSVYAFEYSHEKKGWRCKKCRFVHPTFQVHNAFLPGRADPNPGLMHSHNRACLGDKADLTELVELILKLSSTSSFRFSHIHSVEFQTVVRTVVNGNEDFVTLFTKDVRNKWIDPIKHKIPSAAIDWGQYPVENVEGGEKLVAALVAFARKMGIGYDFVTNKSFVELFRIISPNCRLPKPEDLIVFW